MKIRSITYFFHPGQPLGDARFQAAELFLRAARPAIEAAGFEVQSARLATPPFPELLHGRELPELARTMQSITRSIGYEYISLGPARPARLESYALIPEALAATEDVFLSGMLTTPGGGVSLPAVRACAEVIHRCAPITPDGFTNLRFAALANVGPGAPFFPAAYHSGDEPAFALAAQAADLVIQAFQTAANLEEAHLNLVESLEEQSQRLSSVCETLAQEFGLHFNGLDLTPAPFPDGAWSLGTAIEQLGVPQLGQYGSLAAAAFLAHALDSAQFQKTGFNGLMLPVLEDSTLAERAAQGTLQVKDLLLYSAVCGTGLDTIPLPGDTPAGALAGLLLDLAALAQRLDKPLTARLLPVPGKQAGDQTEYQFAFFANSRVMAVQESHLSGLLSGDETFTLRPRFLRKE